MLSVRNDVRWGLRFRVLRHWLEQRLEQWEQQRLERWEQRHHQRRRPVRRPRRLRSDQELLPWRGHGALMLVRSERKALRLRRNMHDIGRAAGGRLLHQLDVGLELELVLLLRE